MTALSAGAVKAKLLADQEEDQILQLSTFLIEKQVYLPLQVIFDVYPSQLFLESTLVLFKSIHIGMKKAVRPSLPAAGWCS